MDVTQPIRQSFADEHVIGIDPPMRPELSSVWRRHINAFAGRSLSDKAMTAEQDLRSGMQRLYGLSLTPGTVEGLILHAEDASLGAAPDLAFVQLSPGLGIARSGEDISIGRPVRLTIGALPVIIRATDANALGMSPATSGDAVSPVGSSMVTEGMGARIRPELPRLISDPLSAIVDMPGASDLPRVGVVVAQPVAADILGRPGDNCPPDPRDDPYVDLQRIDGARLALYLWPSEMVAIDGGPDYALPAPDGALRNRLAYQIFETERLQGDGDMHPWEAWGVPLALVGFAPDWTLSFIDRHAVGRIGGSPKGRTPIAAGAGDARLWQARLDQFCDQLTDLPSFDASSLQDAFVRMPPVGILPPDMVDWTLRRQHFFPSGYAVDALPVAQSNFNLVVAESAGLAPLDRSQPDSVEILVPVPDSVYEPGLLEVELEDKRFGDAIKSLREARQRWLVRRQMARRRYDRLMETVSGMVIGWPGADLPLEENSPAPHVQTPVEVTRTRRIAAASAKRSHSMAFAHATLTVAASDTIWCWVNIRNNSQMTGLSLRLGTATRPDTPVNFAKGVFWGAPDVMPIAAEAVRLADRRVGDLPDEGSWTRLEIPADRVWDAAGGTLDGFAINAVEFTQRGGEVEWASFGKIDSSGQVYTYIADDAPAGAMLLSDTGNGAGGWPWTTVAGRETLTVDDFGTVVKNDVRSAAALDGFADAWQQPFLKTDLDNVDENGVAAFLSSIDARLKATNDAIDLGFVRARSDIYRVRQIMLGADAASRLVTSPALADLSLRDEGARATSKGISDFLNLAIARTPADTVINIATKPATTGGGSSSSSGGGSSSSGSTGIGGIVGNAFFNPGALTLNIARNDSVLSSPVPRAAAASPILFATPFAAPTSTVATNAAFASIAASLATSGAVFQTATPQQPISINSAALLRNDVRYRVSDIQRQTPIAGLVERTASVAERLTQPPAVQALEYALASKAAVVTTLIGLVDGSGGRPIGIALDDLPMAGFHLKTNVQQVPTLAQLLADRKIADDKNRLYADADDLPDPTKSKHESDYFTNAVQAIDNSIAIMRLVEGRVALFEELAAALRDLRQSIESSANAAGAYLRSVDVEVAEARHDLATAERLRQEEADRIAAVNARRAAILDTHVNAIAWRRRRAADVRDDVPLIEAASGLAPSAVAVCRREHEEAPDEIQDYTQLLREVPVAWFPALAAMVQRINRLDSAHAALRTMIERAAAPRALAAPIEVTAASRFLKGVQSAMVAGRRLIDERQASVAMIDASRIAQLSLAEAHVHLTALSTIGDLLTGAHRQPALTRAATDEIDAINSVAGCLHESFGDVPAIVRLGWAETLSEFDRPAPLAQLAGLSGWGEIAPELRRTLQSFVDFLFGRIDQKQAHARDAINELVRVCLLMAAHAPVDRIIPAHLVTPAPARLGSRIFLTLDITRVNKGMLTLIRDSSDRIISRAVIDDIVDGRAHATITQVMPEIQTITPAMRFQLVGGVAR